jgi:glycosyltransferase involved in cell wall biosynthesis
MADLIRPLNILFVADVSIEKVIGGAERVLYEQTTRLAAKGHRVHLITRRLPEHQSKKSDICGVEEIRCEFERSSALRAIRAGWCRVEEEFLALNKRVRLDCINIHQPMTAHGLIPAAVAGKIPMVYTCHSLGFEEYLSRNQAVGVLNQLVRWGNALGRKWIERRVINPCRQIIALSMYTKDKIVRAHRVRADRVRVIPGGVDLDRFRPAESKARIRRRLGIAPDKFILLTVRNLVPRMGLVNLLAALRLVVNEAPQIDLLIGGVGPQYERLQAISRSLELQNHIRFVGFIPEEDLASYYQMADLFVLPTQALEGFGMATLEALSCGLPVLGTSVGGTPEILSRLDSRFLLPDARPDSIAAGILSYYRSLRGSDTASRETSGMCRRFVEAHYSWERNITAVESIFTSLRPLTPSPKGHAIPRPRAAFPK